MTRSRNEGPAGVQPVLYAVACGSPPAGHLGELVALAQHSGWQVCVVATPDGRKFIDAEALSLQTGFPVRWHYKNPGDRDLLPGPDAIVVAPATVNTVNKWACGIADTLALGMLIEGYGLGLPIAVMPYTNTAMAAHPAFRENLSRLRGWGVRVLFGEDVLALPAPGTGAWQAARFPWWLALAAVGPPQRRSSNAGPQPQPGLAAPQPGPASPSPFWSRNRRAAAPDGRTLLAPPAAPRPAPAIRRPAPMADRAG